MTKLPPRAWEGSESRGIRPSTQRNAAPSQRCRSAYALEMTAGLRWFELGTELDHSRFTDDAPQ